MKFFLLALFVASATAYTLPDCNETPGHSMCLSYVYNVIPITQDDVNLFVNEHNNYRLREAQAGATNIQKMLWSNDLAVEAENWASQCGPSHEPDSTNRHFGDYKIGQNVYRSWKSANWDMNNPANRAEAIAAGVKAWDDERFDYDFDSNTCAEGKVCGHYTQVVWHDSALVGCAVAECPNDWARVVCNYAATGNFNGLRPFDVAGDGCGVNDGLCPNKCDGLVCESGDLDETTCSCNCAPFWTGPTCAEEVPVAGCSYTNTLGWCHVIKDQADPAGVSPLEREQFWCRSYSNVQEGCMELCCDACSVADDKCGLNYVP